MPALFYLRGIMTILQRILVYTFILLLFAQMIRIDKTNVPVNPANDFIMHQQVPTDLAQTLKIACYDCHSDETTYPWYTNYAPVSWWIKHHINEGREHLNFSVWATYSAKKANHKLEECVEMLEEGEMPMSSYTLIHKEAQLTPQQKADLIAFFNLKRSAMARE